MASATRLRRRSRQWTVRLGSGRRSFFSSQLCLYPCWHRCLPPWLIVERPRVSLTKREKPRAARPTEPRDSYASGIRIPHSSPSHEATHTWLSVLASRQASPSARNEEKHGFTPKYINVQAPTAAMNRHRHSRCHYKRNSGSAPAGMNNLHIGEPAGRQTPGDSPAISTAAATVPGRTLPPEGSRSRPHSRGTNETLKPKSRRSVRRWH
jgi:hypothetical protein